MCVALSFPFDYPFIAYFLKKKYSLRQNILKKLRVWERSLTSIPIGAYLGLIEVGTWLGTGSAKEHWRFAEKGRPDTRLYSAPYVRSVHRRWTIAVKEWPDAEIVLSRCLVRWRSCIRSSKDDEDRLDRTLTASGQLWSDASGRNLEGFRPLCCWLDSRW